MYPWSKHLVIGVTMLLMSANASGAGPATGPAVEPSDLHGTWKLDKPATIDRAVAAAPAKDKERVREELTQALPDQTYTFNADATYTILTTPVGGEEAADSGDFALADGALRLVSFGAGGERTMAVICDGESIVLQDALVLMR